MSRFFEQSFGVVGEAKATKVIAYSVTDMTDDENGNTVVSEDFRAAVIKTNQSIVNGQIRVGTTDSVALDVHEIDELIAALKAAKQEIYAKRMAAATVWFNTEREAEDSAN